MKNKEDENKVKFSIPKLINTDLTYYMQFGWKRLNDKSDKKREEIKYSRNAYIDSFEEQID